RGHIAPPQQTRNGLQVVVVIVPYHADSLISFQTAGIVGVQQHQLMHKSRLTAAALTTGLQAAKKPEQQYVRQHLNRQQERKQSAGAAALLRQGLYNGQNDRQHSALAAREQNEGVPPPGKDALFAEAVKAGAGDEEQ